MNNFQFDQAEGLRRMLGEPKQRVFTFLSTVPHRKKNHVLFNLATSLSRSGSGVLLLDATCGMDGVSHYASGADEVATMALAAGGECSLDDIYHHVKDDFDLIRLAHSRAEINKSTKFRKQLDLLFESAAVDADVVLIDGLFAPENKQFPLTVMESSALILKVEDSQKSIKEAYMLIKRLSDHFGRMPYGVMVLDSGESRSQAIFRNMAQTASQYLGVQLYWMGYVPEDEHIARAANLGRSVVDAFPMALSSFAFRRIAGSFTDAGTAVSSYEMAGA